MRTLERSERLSEITSDWIDLIFSGTGLSRANNVACLAYYGSVDVASIKTKAYINTGAGAHILADGARYTPSVTFTSLAEPLS
jgi:hypothetical protein